MEEERGGIIQAAQKEGMVLKMAGRKVFGKYGEYYNILYQDKDYEKECDFLEKIFSKYSESPIKSILEGECGTGGMQSQREDNNVLGFDTSEVMLERAKKKAKDLGVDITFHVSDLRDFQFNETFDSCILMFAMIDYVTWNGLAVLRILPSVRVKVAENKEMEMKVIRTVEPELDAFNHISKSRYKLIALKNNNVVDEIEETHVIRFYFPQEIKHYLEDAGLGLLKICPFMDLNGGVDENVRNIDAIARAVGGKK